MIRKAAWAGRFYPFSSEDIRNQIEKFSTDYKKKTKAKAVLVPHAGYIYSGAVAAEVYSKVELPSRFIIISPNHWEGRTGIAVDTNDAWETPLGLVKVDKELLKKITGNTDKIIEASAPHLKEHAVEVHLPFLQYYKGDDFSFVPITMLSPARSTLDQVSMAIAKAVKDISEPVLIIASSDMSHYISHKDASKYDKLAIDKMLELDPEDLYKTVTENRISMCGLHCIYTAMKSAIELGCNEAVLAKYATSGDASGDYDEVVGYAGVIFK